MIREHGTAEKTPSASHAAFAADHARNRTGRRPGNRENRGPEAAISGRRVSGITWKIFPRNVD